MNKYYLGFPVSIDLIPTLERAQYLVRDKVLRTTKLETSFHITLFYIGACTEQQARDYYNVAHGRTELHSVLTEYEAFKKRTGPHALVLKLQLTQELQAMHDLFVSNNSHGWRYTPHITLAKTESVDFGLPAAAKLLNDEYSAGSASIDLRQLTLYEKSEGGEYHPLMVYDLGKAH